MSFLIAGDEVYESSKFYVRGLKHAIDEEMREKYSNPYIIRKAKLEKIHALLGICYQQRDAGHCLLAISKRMNAVFAPIEAEAFYDAVVQGLMTNHEFDLMVCTALGIGD